jgi:hypothetical protein
MSRPTVLEGALVALIGAVSGTLAFAALAWALPAGTAVRLVTAALGIAYLIYLLGRSRDHVGRLAVLALWVLTAVALWILTPSVPLYLAGHLGVLSLVRSLYFQQGPLGALADLGLTALSLMAGAGAFLHTGSLFLAIWSLFLVQAMFVFVPDRASPKGVASRDDDRFGRAHRAAEEAVRKLSASL